jgi:dTDP-4-amino-4,6-dideoxygalactose transaminase
VVGEMIPLYKPYVPENLPEIQNILRSGNLCYGEWSKLFEKKISKYLGIDDIVAVNSYNSALLVTISTLGLTPGDQVIASPISCLASNQPFATMGIQLIWADIDPLTGTLSPDDVEKKITKKTKAIIHNHFCGYPGYIEQINNIGKKYGIYVIDDAIEAFGSIYKSKYIGNTGSDVTVFSFQTVRLPNTIEGGAIAFKDPLLIEKAKRIRDYGIDRKFFRDETGEISRKCDIREHGYGALPNEISSYIGCITMDQIDNLLLIQKSNAVSWERLLFEYHPDINFLKREETIPNYWVMGVLSENKLVDMNIFRQKGFFTSSVHINNDIYSVFGKTQPLPGVNKFLKKFFALPSGWWFSSNFI